MWSARRPMERPSSPSLDASCVAAARMAARLLSPSARRRRGSTCVVTLDKIARSVVLCRHGERTIVLTTGDAPARSAQELHAAWADERNRGLVDWLWTSIRRRRRLRDEHLAQRRLAELPDARLRDL